MSNLGPWLQHLGLEKYLEVLARQDIDLAVAPDLTEQDLEKLGLSLGHRRKFLAAAAKLRAEAPLPAPASTEPEPHAQSVAPVERRQVTVVFADLVGSAALGDELDPEDLLRLLRQYRETSVAVIGKYDGFIAQYLGDGMLVYFGFPQAQEHAAERAVRASLEIVEKVEQLRRPNGLPLQCRLGIATGLVVAGEGSSVGAAGEGTVVGSTPNLAARLQSLAEPNSVLVGPLTHQLTTDFFEYSYLGEQAIKGFRSPVPVWKVLRESATTSRFAASHGVAATPIVGRERELTFLHDAWRRATQGNGHVALLVGEAGMGKSRLLEALAEQVSEPHTLLRCQCSPYHRNSVLFPMKMLLRHRLELSRELPARDNLDRIARMLAQIGRPAQVSAFLLAELLEIPSGDAASAIDMTPNQRKEETLAILEDVLMAPVDGTVLLLIEDAHWSDQTTQTLISRLLKRIERERALVLITHRPELKTNWFEHPQATQISCKQIGHQHCAVLVRHLATGTQVDDATVQQIVARSDGVPLFVEELTKAVMQLGALDAGAVPLTLKDALTARLDRLGDAKDVAQIASVVGRQFSHPLLAAIAGARESDLLTALTRLRESGLIFETGDDGEASYSFNHSLVQEAAYEGLARSRKQSLHEQIARHLEADSENEPTVIAHHYGAAGRPEKSSQFWLLAGDRAGQRLAFAEAIANLNFALAEAERVADPELRARLMVDAQLQLGTTLAIYKGTQNDEAGSALELARTLAKEANAGPQLFQATWGAYSNAARNRQFDKAAVRGEELLTISEELGDQDLMFEALHHRWGMAYFTGQTAKALRFTAEGIEGYDRDRHHKFSYTFAGHDPGVCAYCVRALMLGVAGRSRSVKNILEEGLALSESLQHPLTTAFAISVECAALHITGDAEGCGKSAERLLQVSNKYDLPNMRAIGLFIGGGARALAGDVAPALKSMEPTLEATLSNGFLASLPGIIMVDALARAGRNREALALITRLLDETEPPTAGVFIPELWRMRGELLLRESAGNLQLAERYIATAVRVAAQQGAPVYHVRAGIAQARLLAETGRREEARIVLDGLPADELTEWQGPEMANLAELRLTLG